ncbi:GDSL esterase/lipase [Tripterygium wilfordii]|uniref:GDSL esterase/lipase n=1 Tax=Tripterygium wilfordii TaxID=458696 RepID=A0A7J7C5M0_TRIWF|nr:GDSL esterase/lipase [Tripterygium wilfordii]
MEKQTNILFLFLLFINVIPISTGHEQVQETSDPHGSLKLFVFGDSYADTGNQKKSALSWNKPYGTTFPGKPAGRFSDGHILTDYIASFMGIETPLAYVLRKYKTHSDLRRGMNFAYGGSGVFNTVYQAPNMSTQIDFFQQLVENNFYTKSELRSSIALVSLAGNDYTTFIVRNADKSKEATNAFTRSIIEQLTKNLKRIAGLGVRKIMVTGSQPLGCLPVSTAISGFKSCNETNNEYAIFHNLLLREEVYKMNIERRRVVFGILDLYDAFMSAFKSVSHPENPLKPCCVGVNGNNSCGSVDEKGEAMYVVCNDPKSSMFWDTYHPTQNGWHSVYMALQPQLHKLIF